MNFSQGSWWHLVPAITLVVVTVVVISRVVTIRVVLIGPVRCLVVSEVDRGNEVLERRWGLGSCSVNLIIVILRSTVGRVTGDSASNTLFAIVTRYNSSSFSIVFSLSPKDPSLKMIRSWRVVIWARPDVPRFEIRTSWELQHPRRDRTRPEEPTCTKVVPPSRSSWQPPASCWSLSKKPWLQRSPADRSTPKYPTAPPASGIGTPRARGWNGWASLTCRSWRVKVRCVREVRVGE